MHLGSFKEDKKKYYFLAETIKKDNKVIQKEVLYSGNADTPYKKLIKLKKN